MNNERLGCVHMLDPGDECKICARRKNEKPWHLKGSMKKEARFLLDRLEEYDPEDEDHVRDFHGHVAPAIARLRSALADKSNPHQRKPPEDRPLSLQNALKRSLRGLAEKGQPTK